MSSALYLVAFLLLLAPPPAHPRLLQEGSSDRVIKMIMKEYGRKVKSEKTYHRSVTSPPPPKSSPPRDQTTITLPKSPIQASTKHQLRFSNPATISSDETYFLISSS